MDASTTPIRVGISELISRYQAQTGLDEKKKKILGMGKRKIKFKFNQSW